MQAHACARPDVYDARCVCGVSVLAACRPHDQLLSLLGSFCHSLSLANSRAQVFNGGSDFNEPIKRCLERLHSAAWANSDILLVSDGELRQPGTEIMRKLAGACCLHACQACIMWPSWSTCMV